MADNQNFIRNLKQVLVPVTFNRNPLDYLWTTYVFTVLYSFVQRRTFTEDEPVGDNDTGGFESVSFDNDNVYHCWWLLDCIIIEIISVS